MFVLIVIGLVVVSVLWAVWSLRELLHSKVPQSVKKELSSGRVVFHKDAYSSEKSSSSSDLLAKR